MIPIVQPPSKLQLLSRLFKISSRWKDVLYVHIPFCLQRCKFCVYFSAVPRGRSEIQKFIRHLEGQIEQADLDCRTRPFDEIYFGGGTPTMLRAEEFDHLLRRIPGVRDISMKASEASPKTLKYDHVQLFKEWGFKYVSIGVQTFDTKVLDDQGREHVDVDILAEVIKSMEQDSITTNVDLIFFLGPLGVAGLEQGRKDLRIVMQDIRPSSITVHSNYQSKKSLYERQAMIRILREECDRSGEYTCTNSLLKYEDAEEDIKYGSEYRLMRRSKDFEFYLIGKRPLALRWGHNILALGEYDRFRLRSNYYYFSDFYPKYAVRHVLDEALNAEFDLASTRSELGIAHTKPYATKDFFVSEKDRQQFIDIMHEEGMPLLPEVMNNPIRNLI